MSGRILLAGILGGILVFIWGAISHMVLPIGEMGITELPKEEPVVAAMRENIAAPGFYFFPGMGVPHSEATDEQKKAWEEKYRQGPTGILIYQPAGSQPLSPAQLGTELGSNILAALVAALLLAQVAGGAWITRALLVALMGLFVGLDVDASQWNWYGFPTDYTLAQMADHVIGWFFGGLAIGKIVPGQ